MKHGCPTKYLQVIKGLARYDQITLCVCGCIGSVSRRLWNCQSRVTDHLQNSSLIEPDDHVEFDDEQHDHDQHHHTTSTTTTSTTTTTTTTVPTTTTTVFDPDLYQEVAKRDYALVMRSPDDHVGETYVIYGVVTQFDAATGLDAFRADTSHAPQDNWYDYEYNTILVGDEELFANVVQDDIVKMWVTCAGSITYDTQIGGSTTVPAFRVDKIELIGSRD